MRLCCLQATGSRSKPKANHAEASAPGDAEDEDENEPSSQMSEEDDPTPVASPEDPSKRRKGRSRVSAAVVDAGVSVGARRSG